MLYKNRSQSSLFICLLVGTVTGELSTAKETILNDVEAARTLLMQMEERLNILETKATGLEVYN